MSFSNFDNNSDSSAESINGEYSLLTRCRKDGL